MGTKGGVVYGQMEKETYKKSYKSEGKKKKREWSFSRKLGTSDWESKSSVRKSPKIHWVQLMLRAFAAEVFQIFDIGQDKKQVTDHQRASHLSS